MTRIHWEKGELIALGEYMDKNPVLGNLQKVRAAQIGVLPVQRHRNIIAVSAADRIIEQIAAARSQDAGKSITVLAAPAEPVAVQVTAPTAATMPLVFTVAEFDRIKGMLHPNVKIQVIL